MPTSSRLAGAPACVIALASALCFTASLPAFAAAGFPEKPVRLIVPFPSGGGTDTIARLLAKQLSLATGQSFVVENRAGASGNIGMDAIAKARPDGYTIGITTSNLTMNSALYRRLAFDPKRDIAPITMIASSPLVIGVSSSLNVSTLAALKARTISAKDPLSYSSCGNGTPEHFAGAMLAAAWQVNLVHVPYKGCAPAMIDALGGQVPVFVSTIANTKPYINDGRVRLLAVTARDRNALMPGVPSTREEGVGDIDVRVWFGLVAPAGLPEDVLKRLVSLSHAALQKPELRNALAEQGYDTVDGGPERFAANIAKEIPFWKQLSAKYSISLD